MTMKTLALAGVLSLVLFIGIGMAVDTAWAQDDDLGGGGGTKLGTKTFEKEKLPNKWEMAAGVGSLFVAYAVVKWL